MKDNEQQWRNYTSSGAYTYRNTTGGAIYSVCKIDCTCFTGTDLLYIGESTIVSKYSYSFIFSYSLAKNIIMLSGHFELKSLCINFL